MMKKGLILVIAIVAVYMFFGGRKEEPVEQVYDRSIPVYEDSFPAYSYAVPTNAYAFEPYSDTSSYSDMDTTCPICKGSGSRTCSGCDGSGQMEKTNYAPSFGLDSGGNAYTTFFRCVQCDGSGENPCMYCGGTGSLS